jgi:hypothetical protein
MNDEQTAGQTTKKTNGAAPPSGTKVPDVFANLDEIRRDTADLLNETAVPVTLAVRRPKSREYFRVYEGEGREIALGVYVHRPEGSMDDETFLITRKSAAEDYLLRNGELKIKHFVLCQSARGATFLWGLPTAEHGEAVRPHVRSAHKIANAAKAKWVRLKWVRASADYEQITAEDLHQQPVWPDLTLQEILALAFPVENIISDLDHPVMLELRGIEPKKGGEAHHRSAN